MPKISLECGKLGKLNNKFSINAVAAEAWRRPLPSGALATESVDPYRSHLNRYYINPRWDKGPDAFPDYERAITDLMAERCQASGRVPRKIKPGAVLVRSFIYQVSPEHFFPRIRQEHWDENTIKHSTFKDREPLDMAAVDAWHKTMQARLQERWGDCLLATELHLDETGPHLHCQIVPVTPDGRLSSKELFSPSAITRHLDEAAQWCKPLGLSRATKGGEPDHEQHDPHEWIQIREAQRIKDLEKAKAKEAALNPAPAPWLPTPTPMPPKPTPPKPPKKPETKDGFLGFGRDDSWETDQVRKKYQADLESYQARMDVYERELEDWRKECQRIKDPAWQLQEQQRQMADRLAYEEEQRQILREEVAAQRARADKAEAEARKASKAARQAEARALREIPLADVLARIYSDRDPHQDEGKMWLVKLDPDEAAKAGHSWRRIGITGLKFIDNRDHGFAGRGAIDLVMAMDGHRDYKRAAAKLAAYFPLEDVARDMATVEPAKLAKVLEESLPPPEPEPAAPAPDPRKKADLHNYLTRQLAIQPDIARHLAESAQVYMDDRRNLVIPRPSGGAFIRGTVALRSGEPNRYKRTTGSRHAGASVLTGPKVKPGGHVILAEGPRSALALLSEYPQSTIYIVGGSLHADLPDLRGRQVWLAFDNDDGGQQHRAFYKNLFPEAKPLTPPTAGQDWLDRHLELVAERQAKARAEAEAIRQMDEHSRRLGGPAQ